MATRIRLQRHGKKNKAFFHLVAADSRAKRDGKFIEKLGTYNPNTNPATIDINFERTLSWVQTGAEMSDTARAILSYKGVLYKHHLIKGIKKGALTEEQVEAKFAEWQAQKDAKVTGKKDSLAKKADLDKANRLKAEEAVNEAKAKEVEAKNTVVEEVEEAAVETTDATTDATEEVVAEDFTSEDQPVSEESTEVTTYEPASEESTEEPASEVTTDEPASEESTEEPASEE
ncbi:MAG: 30S ribosomal protein S16 [Bacteroidota bacterium]